MSPASMRALAEGSCELVIRAQNPVADWFSSTKVSDAAKLPRPQAQSPHSSGPGP